MTARRSNRRKAEEPSENKSVKRKEKPLETNKKEIGKISQSIQEDEESEEPAEEEELPYASVAPLPTVTRQQKGVDEDEEKDVRMKGFNNRAPLQSDDKAKNLIKEALKNPIGITTEDLLNISEPARQELRKLLTKKRMAKKAVSFVVENEEDKDSPEEGILFGSQLPDVSYVISEKDTSQVPKGAVIIEDPVVQYLSTLQPGEKPRKVVVARESCGLRSVYPLVNKEGEVESLLDGGSQIVSMSKEVAVDLKITWDPDVIIHMESANKSLQKSLGLAKNVPFLFGHITIYLQVHVMEDPAYKVLLGRPFDTVTESLVQNTKEGSQLLTLTDPNTGERCVMHTHERGKRPTVLKKPEREGFCQSSRNW